MKKVSLLVLICMMAALMLTTFTACDNHTTHTAGTEWLMDATNHYHMCTGCQEKLDSAAHVDENNDEACDVCGIKMSHTVHAFGNTWSYDAANHYNVCAECGAKDASAAHADANNDGACDVCAVVMANNHVYDKAWTADATNHWHAPICGHDVEASGKAAHTVNALGECSVCGYKLANPVVSTAEEAIAVAILTGNRVTAGNYSYGVDYGWSDAEATFYPTSFEYGNGFLKTYDVANNITVYVTKNADGTVTYFENWPADVSPIEVNTAADARLYNGVEVNLADYISDGVVVYGAAELLEFFASTYPESAEDITVNYAVQEMTEGTVYAATYAIPVDETTSREIQVMFTLDGNYAIEKLQVAITYGGDITILRYDQISGPVNEGDPFDIVPKEITLKDKDGETIELTNNTAAAIDYFVMKYDGIAIEIAPDTALVEALGEIEPVIKDAAGEKVAGSVAYASFDKNTHKVVIDFYAEGTYYVNIPLGTDTFVVPFNVTYDIPTAIDVKVPGGYDSYVSAPETMTMYITADSQLTFVASFADGCKLNAYTAAVTSANAADATLTNALVDDGFGHELLTYTFKTSTVGEYTVKFTSTEAPTVEKTITINAVQPPLLSTLTVGKWQFSETDNWGETQTITANFYPANNEKGVVVVDYLINASYGQFFTTSVYTYYIYNEVMYTEFVDGEYFEGDPLEVVANEYYETYYADTSIYTNASYNWVYDYKELTKVSDTADAYTGSIVLPEGDAIPDPVAPGNPPLLSSYTLNSASTQSYDITLAAGESHTAQFDYYINGSIQFAFSGEVTASITNRDDQVISAGTDGSTYNGEPISFVGDDDWYSKLHLTNNTDAEITITVTVTITEA